MMEVTIYSTPSCPFCKQTKEWLKEKGVEYKEVNVAEDEAGRETMIEKSQQTGVPVTIIKDGDKESVIVGFDQPKLAEATGK
tara:strand:- start:171 stop:416 length:246 start_codon:yes stop_codon:yes gene_type:complete